MKPLISYYGGKQRLAKYIIPILPPHTVYVEPFAGGCSVLFAKGVPDVTRIDFYREVINDTDSYLITMYRVFQNNFEEFYHRLKFTLYSEEEHSLSKHILTHPDGYSELDIAWAYFVNISQSFSNTLLRGWKRGVYGRNFGVTWDKEVENLNFLVNRFSGVNISHTDALTCIKQWDSPQTCFYVDPPYIGSHQGHYSGYTLDQYKSLIEILSNCSSSFVLSHYDVLDVTIPNEWERYEIQSYSSSSGKGKINADRSRKATSEELGNMHRTEILWKVDRSKNVRKELVPVINKLFPDGKMPVEVNIK